MGNPGQEQWPLASRGNKPRYGLSLVEVLKRVKTNQTHGGITHGVDHGSCQRFLCRLRDWKGLGVCKTYCTPNATFAAQAEPLAEIKTLAEYADWMKGLMTIYTGR